MLTTKSLVIQKLLVKLFTKNNCNAIVVNNGQEVLDYLANPLNPRPNLIFLDVCCVVSVHSSEGANK